MTILSPTARVAMARKWSLGLTLRISVLALLAGAMATSFAAPAQAQSTAPPPVTDGKVPAGAAAAKVAKPAAATSVPESGLKSRVDSLEEQLVDMQVLVGTLESLAKSGGGSAPQAYHSGGAAAGGADAMRVEALENQVRALSNQVQGLSDQVRSMGGTPRRSEAASPPPPVAQNPNNAFEAPPASGGDAIGGLIDVSPVTSGGVAAGGPQTGTVAGGPPQVTTAALPPAGDITNPKQLYETAYGYLLQRDYGAAESAFDDFLKKFPADSLSGNAQYWLGETHFVRGQYKAAAGAFLKGYQTYAQSTKAPDSLLKLAMSLDRLGQKDAACASYSELNAKFPNAPQSVRARAQSERQRVGCP